MHPLRKKRLLWLVFLFSGIVLAATLVFYALGQNINVFYSPSQIVAGEVPSERLFRIGGIVVNESVARNEQDLWVEFVLTDEAHEVTVYHEGILPDLFREGQGIVALGRLNEQGDFIAQEVLAKHDADYMPPEVQAALESARSS